MKSVLSWYKPALALLIIALIFFAHYSFMPHITGDILTYCNSYRFCIRLQTIQISIGQAYCVCTQLMFCRLWGLFSKVPVFFSLLCLCTVYYGGDLSAKVKPGQDHTSCSERHVGKAVVCKSGNFLVFFCLTCSSLHIQVLTSRVSIQSCKCNLCANKHRCHPTSQRDQNRHILVNWHQIAYRKLR